MSAVESFSAITADGFKDAALFEENILSFPVCYGVALQALRQTRIRTSLLPREISTARTIARKKPWAVAAAAVLLVALAMSATGFAHVYNSVSEKQFGEAEKSIDDISKKCARPQNGVSEGDNEQRGHSSRGGDSRRGARSADAMARVV